MELQESFPADAEPHKLVKKGRDRLKAIEERDARCETNSHPPTPTLTLTLTLTPTLTLSLAGSLRSSSAEKTPRSRSSPSTR